MSDKPEQDKIVNTADLKKQAQIDASLQSGGILKNALKMAFGTMSSRVLGLLRESLLAALFDKHITDSWAAAFRIPNLFRRLLGEGSLSVSFIPVFVDSYNDSTERARNLVNSVYTILLLILSVITTVGVVFPEFFLGFVLDPSYIAQVEKYALTVHMAKIMFLFVFFISSFAFFMGILNALGQFFWPAIAPTFWNLAMVISTIWPASWLSIESQKYGDQLAWGVVIGGFLQAAVLVPSLIKSGYLPKISFRIFNPDTKKVFMNMAPGLVGMGLLQFTTIINLRFSSSLAEGTISFINYVDRLVELPLSLISVSLGTALLPVLSKLCSEKKLGEMAQTTKKYLELNLFVSISAAFGMYAVAQPIIDLLFGRGRFSAADVLATTEILKTYCWIMVFVSAVRVITPAYYAVKNTWLPAVASGVGLVVHIFLAPALMAEYKVHGLLVSTIVSAFLNLIILLAFYNYFVSKYDYWGTLKKTIQFIFVGVGIFLLASAGSYLGVQVGSSTIFSVLFAIGFSAAGFIIAAQILKIDEVNRLVHRVLRRS